MKNALVVDDTKNIRLLLSKSLEVEGFKVYSAMNATEALAIMKKINFEIAFIDIKMPNISGTALLQTLRDEGYLFPVVIMTAFGTIRNAVTTTQLGAKAYLQKPFTANTIRKTLAEVFESSIHEPSKDTLLKTNLKIITNPLDPKSYSAISNYLLSIGDVEKGILFEKFSKELENLI